MKYFDYGVVSLGLELQFECDWEELIRLSSRWIEAPDLERSAIQVVRKRMADMLGHVGAWAPKAEQIAAAKLLDSPEVIRSYQNVMKAHVRERLDYVFELFRREGVARRVVRDLKAEGLELPARVMAKEGYGTVAWKIER